MKKTLFLLIACALSTQFSFSQSVDNSDGFDLYDAKAETYLDRILFGDTRIFAEYIYSPSFRDVLAFRIVKDRCRETYTLQVFRLSNSQEKMREIHQASSTTAPELYRKYSPKPKSFEVSERFAVELRGEMTAVLMRGFKPMERTPGVIEVVSDGESATFRCVVDGELWARRIHMPKNRALQLSDICNKIITDALKGRKPNEAKYIKLLREIDFWP